MKSWPIKKLGERETLLNYRSFEKNLFPPDLAFSPPAAIKRFNQAAKIYGIDVILKNKRFQKAREVWVGAVFLIAWSRMTKKEYWIRPEYDNAPDVCGVFFERHPEHSNADRQRVINFEITDWQGSKTESLTDRIEKKLSKNYPEHFWLLIYINSLGESINLEIICEKIEKNRSSSPVFIVSSDDSNGKPEHTIIGLLPYRLRFNFDLEREVLENKQTPDVIKVIFRRGHNINELSVLPLEFPKLD